MVECSKVNFELSDSQLNKLKFAVKNQAGVILRMKIKMLKGNNLPYEILLTTRQKNKIRYPLKNNM